MMMKERMFTRRWKHEQLIMPAQEEDLPHNAITATGGASRS